MITSMHIENFKCFKDFDIELGPFNVLIGPNDTGKTALLQAIRIVCVLDWGGTALADQVVEGVGVPWGRDAIFSKARPNEAIAIQVEHRQEGTGAPLAVARTDVSCRNWSVVRRDNPEQVKVGIVSFYQFDPRSLRRPTEISADFGSDGTGLPGFIARMALERGGAMDSLEDSFRRRFPFYEAIVTNPIAGNKGDMVELRLRTVQGAELPCQSVSDGVMLSLAFMAVFHAKKAPNTLLIEEPEAGVHHASLKDIVETLKHLSKDKGVQVILTTHSPYLLDHVEPDQVHVFRKDEEGAVHAKKLSEFEDVADMKSHYMSGEIWSILSEAHKF